MTTVALPPMIRGGHVMLPADVTATVEHVPLSKIRVPDNHCRMDAGHLSLLLDLVKPDEHLPPALLLADGAGGWWLLDGRHRYVFALVAGRNTLFAVCLSAAELRGKP